jgi:hypothetical protein
MEMRKKAGSITMTDDSWDIVDDLANSCGASKSRMMELFVVLANTYFDKEQLKIELEMSGPLDGRKDRWAQK